MECVFIYSKACLPSQVCDRSAVLKFYSSNLAAELGWVSELRFCIQLSNIRSYPMVKLQAEGGVCRRGRCRGEWNKVEMVFLFSQTLKKNKQRIKQQMAWTDSKMKIFWIPWHPQSSQGKLGATVGFLRPQDRNAVQKAESKEKKWVLAPGNLLTIAPGSITEDFAYIPGKPAWVCKANGDLAENN